MFVVDVDDIQDAEVRREPGSRPTRWFYKVAISGKLWELERYGLAKAQAKEWLQSPPAEVGPNILIGLNLPGAEGQA